MTITQITDTEIAQAKEIENLIVRNANLAKEVERQALLRKQDAVLKQSLKSLETIVSHFGLQKSNNGKHSYVGDIFASIAAIQELQHD
jgi:hypothetical protein